MLTLLLAALISLAPVRTGGLTASSRRPGGHPKGRPELGAADKLRPRPRRQLSTVPHLADGAGRRRALAAARDVGRSPGRRSGQPRCCCPCSTASRPTWPPAALANRAFRTCPGGRRPRGALEGTAAGHAPRGWAVASSRPSRARPKNAAKLALLDAVKARTRVRAAGSSRRRGSGTSSPPTVLVRQNDLGAGPPPAPGPTSARGQHARPVQPPRAAVRAARAESARGAGPVGIGGLDVLEGRSTRSRTIHLIGDHTGPDGEKLIEAAARHARRAGSAQHLLRSKGSSAGSLDLRRNYAGIGAYVNTIDQLPPSRARSTAASLRGRPASGTILINGGPRSTRRTRTSSAGSRAARPEVEILGTVTAGLRARVRASREVIIPSSTEMLPGGIGYAD